MPSISELTSPTKYTWLSALSGSLPGTCSKTIARTTQVLVYRGRFVERSSCLDRYARSFTISEDPTFGWYHIKSKT
jgi:hypothetical protein